MRYLNFIALLLISFTLQNNAFTMEMLPTDDETKAHLIEREDHRPSSTNLRSWAQTKPYIDSDGLDSLPECRCKTQAKVMIEIIFNCNSDIPEWLASTHGIFSLTLRYENSIPYAEELTLEGRLHPSLHTLTLDGCNLKVIPEAIKHLPNLKKLIIKNNPGIKLREGCLPHSLRHFNLLSGGLRTVPAALRTMEFLTSISLHGNPEIAIKPGDVPSSLQELHLCHCGWTAEQFAPIAATLRYLREVTY